MRLFLPQWMVMLCLVPLWIDCRGGSPKAPKENGLGATTKKLNHGWPHCILLWDFIPEWGEGKWFKDSHPDIGQPLLLLCCSVWCGQATGCKGWMRQVLVDCPLENGPEKGWRYWFCFLSSQFRKESSTPSYLCPQRLVQPLPVTGHGLWALSRLPNFYTSSKASPRSLPHRHILHEGVSLAASSLSVVSRSGKVQELHIGVWKN